MRCPTCHTPTSLNDRFCSSCGTALKTMGPAHDQPIVPEQKFCSHCGTALTPPLAQPTSSPLPPAERKRVTILFADLVGSTALAEEMDAEQVHALYNGSLQRMSQAVAQMGGTVGALMGDGMMAIFGAPVAHEDDPERAALAALAIIEAIKQYAESTGLPIQVRVGLNTGRVMMGQMGGVGRSIYTAVGEAVNLAARMESAAAPNTILASATTWDSLAPHFEGHALGTIAIKGKKTPVPVFRVDARKARDSRVGGSGGMRAPLVGRTEERAALGARLRALTDSALGAGGILFITGEAGIGKSRLVAEITQEAETLKVCWLEGRSVSYSRTQPYWPWLGLFRQWVGVESRTEDEGFRAALQEALHHLLGDEAKSVFPFLAALCSLRQTRESAKQLAQLTPEIRQLYISLAVIQWLKALSAEKPLILSFEDMHWADPSSITLIERCVEQTMEHPILFLVATRLDDAEIVLSLRDSMMQKLPERAIEYRLFPLDRAQASELITRLLDDSVPSALVELIERRADGNPFFTEEILRALLEEGVLVREEKRWKVARPLDSVRLPETVEGVLAARIDRLDTRQKRLLQQASVIGRVFWRRVLVNMSHQGPELDESLYHLGHADLIRQRGWQGIWETEYIFSHALIQETAYRAIPRALRRTYHREVAQTIEALLPGNTSDYLGVLATHWERAGDQVVARTYLEQAGDHAAEQYSNAEAVNFYTRALALLDEEQLIARYDLLQKRQLLYESLGQREARQADLNAMLEIAKRLDDPRRLVSARAYGYLFTIYIGDGLSLPEGLDEEILADLAAVGAHELQLELLELLSIRYWWGFFFPLDRDKAHRMQVAALQVAERLGDEHRILLNRAVLAEQQGEPQVAVAALTEALHRAEQIGDLQKQWLIYHRMGRLLAKETKPLGVEYHQRSMDIGRRMANTRLELIGADNLARTASDMGDYERAYHAWKRAVELQRKRGQTPVEQANTLLNFADILIWSGRPHQAAAMAKEVEAIASSVEDEVRTTEAALYLARAMLLAGNIEQAETIYRRWGALDPQDLPQTFPEHLLFPYAVDVGRYYFAQPNLPAARQVLQHALELYERLPEHVQSRHTDMRLYAMGLLLMIEVAMGSQEEVVARVAQVGKTIAAYQEQEWPLPTLHLGLYRAYTYLDQSEEASHALEAAHEVLIRHASYFGDQQWREAFLDATDIHQEIWRLWQQRQTVG